MYRSRGALRWSHEIVSTARCAAKRSAAAVWISSAHVAGGARVCCCFAAYALRSSSVSDRWLSCWSSANSSARLCARRVGFSESGHVCDSLTLAIDRWLAVFDAALRDVSHVGAVWVIARLIFLLLRTRWFLDFARLRSSCRCARRFVGSQHIRCASLSFLLCRQPVVASATRCAPCLVASALTVKLWLCARLLAHVDSRSIAVDCCDVLLIRGK